MTVENETNLVVDHAETPTTVDETADIGAAWDRVMVQNGADRAEDGKFVSPDSSGAGSSLNPPSEDGAGEDGSSSTVAAVSPAPAHLPQAIKADWEKIPEGARTAIMAHQAEMDRKFGEIGKQYGAVKPIADKLTEFTTKFPAFKGRTPEQLAEGAAQLAAVQVELDKGPESAVKTILDVARTYKVLPMLAAAFQQQGDQSQLVVGLQQKIANLEAELQKASNPDHIREHVTKTLAERETETAVCDFAKGKDHWAEVEADIPHFIRIVQSTGRQLSPVDTLNEAYDMAINAIPAVREKVRAAEAAKATAAITDPKRAAEAKKAASINVKSTANGKERPLTFEESAGAAYDRLMAS